MAYTNCPVSHRTPTASIAWYEWLDKSQGHSVLSIWSRSDLPSPLELSGDCAHSLAHTPLEGGNTLQTQQGPLKLLVERGRAFRDIDSVLRSAEQQSNFCP